MFFKTLNNTGFICFWSQHYLLKWKSWKKDLSRLIKFMSEDGNGNNIFLYKSCVERALNSRPIGYLRFANQSSLLQEDLDQNLNLCYWLILLEENNCSIQKSPSNFKIALREMLLNMWQGNISYNVHFCEQCKYIDTHRIINLSHITFIRKRRCFSSQAWAYFSAKLTLQLFKESRGQRR